MTNTKYIIRDENTGACWLETLCEAHAEQMLRQLEKTTGWIFHLFTR